MTIKFNANYPLIVLLKGRRKGAECALWACDGGNEGEILHNLKHVERSSPELHSELYISPRQLVT